MKSIKRIAIFGDSFADSQSVADFNDDTAWPDIIEKRGIKIHNFSQTGSSLFNAWQKYNSFIKSPLGKICNTIIFVITEPGREKLFLNNKIYWLTGENKLRFFRDHMAPNAATKKLFDSLYNYWIYVKDHDYDDLFHSLLVDKIKANPNVFYIDAFSKSSLSLFDISFKELSYWNPLITDRLHLYGYHDRRKCHLSQENNMMVADKIYTAVLNGLNTVEFIESDVKLPSRSMDYYLEDITKNISLIHGN